MKGAEAEYLSPDDEANSVDSVDIFPHQVGGHHLIVKHPSRPDLIVKPHFSKETQFYQDAQGDPLLQEIVAKYYGELFLPLLGDCIVLEDLTYGMDEPCILDIKIGRRLHDDDATPEKTARLKAKAETSTSLCVGFRISVNGQVIIRLKRDVRSVTKSELLPMMEKFFAHLSPNDALTLLQRYQLTLEKIRCAVETSNGHFYSSSILFVYDHYNINRWDCRMIDFVHSHIFPPDQLVVDDNYLEGLHSLYEHLKRLQARFKEETCDESTQ